MKIKFNQNLLDRLIKEDQRNRFLLLYPYLKSYVFPALRSNKFRETSNYDWDDLCSQTYCDIFILCDNNDWLDYHPNQVKRFLFVVSSNSMLRYLNILYKNKDKIVSMNNIDNYDGVLCDVDNISVFDEIEDRGYIIERQLIRIYQRLLGRRIVNEEYKTVLGRYARIIAGRTIEESDRYEFVFSVSRKTNEVLPNVSSFS